MLDALAKVSGMSRDELSVIEHIHGGAGSIWFTELFGANDFATPWRFIHYAILPPGGGIGHHGHEDSEEVFVTLDNAAQFTHNGRTTEIVGGATVPLRAGETHAIYNHTDRDTHFLNFHVVDPKGEPRVVELEDDRAGAALEPADRLPIGRLDRGLLKITTAHGGRGEIRARAIWESRDFRTNFWAVGHAVMGAGTSVGYHRHDTIEECYAIMAGRGRMTVDGETFEVEPHDVIVNRLGGCHGIVNDGPNDLELLTVAVSMVKGEADEDDLGDDLMGSG